MIPLKRIFFAPAAFLACLAVFFIFKNVLHPPESVAKIRVKSMLTPETPPPLFALSRDILSQPVLSEAVISLGPSGLSRADLRKKAAELRDRVTVSRGEAPGIFTIRYAHRDSARAARVVNAIAVSFRDFYAGSAKAEISSRAASLDREIQVFENEIAELETLLEKLQKESEPDEVDVQLALKYRALENRHRELSKTFTGLYPEIIELENEMAALQAQIMDASFHDPADIERVRLRLAESRAACRRLRTEREDLNLKMLQVEGKVHILTISRSSSQSIPSKAPLFFTLVGVSIPILSTLRYLCSR